jgi:hypothetical protein
VKGFKTALLFGVLLSEKLLQLKMWKYFSRKPQVNQVGKYSSDTPAMLVFRKFYFLSNNKKNSKNASILYVSFRVLRTSYFIPVFLKLGFARNIGING